MVFTTEGFFEAAVESWPEWDLNPLPLNSVQMPVAYPEVNLGTLRVWENQLGVCKPPSGYRAEPCWLTGGKAPGKF